MDHAQFDFSNEAPLTPINVLVCDNKSLFREILVSALDKGTSGWSFLLKQSISDIHSLSRAIESAAAGQVTMDPTAILDLLPRQRSVLERLTHNQMEALCLFHLDTLMRPYRKNCR